MRNKLFVKILGCALSAVLAFTSALPAMAADIELSEDVDFEEIVEENDIVEIDEPDETDSFEEYKEEDLTLESDETERSVVVTVPTVTTFGEAYGNKGPDDIQSGIEIFESKLEDEDFQLFYIEGTLKEVKGWTEFGGDGLTSGHYLALKVNASGTPKKLEVWLSGGKQGRVDLTDDPEKTAILRIDDKGEQLCVEATYEDGEVIRQSYTMAGIKMEGLDLDADIDDSIDLFGKKASDLQENISFDGYSIKGTLNFITDYTGFSTEASEQVGYYLALHGSFTTGESLILTDGEDNEYSFDLETGILVLKSQNEGAPFTLKKTYADGSYTTRDYWLWDLKHESVYNSITMEVPENVSLGDAYGNKKPEDLQKDLIIRNYSASMEDGSNEIQYNYSQGIINGTLKEVIGWTDSWPEGEQSGHYIALKPNAPGAVKVEIESDGKKCELNEDGVAVIRVRAKWDQIIYLNATYADGMEVRESYWVHNLVLEGSGLDADIDEETDLYGKKVTELQENITITASNYQIEGELKYIDDYSAAFEKGRDKGHYLALHQQLNTDETAYITYGETRYDIDPKTGLVVMYIPEDYGTFNVTKTYADGSVEEIFHIHRVYLGLKDQVEVTFMEADEEGYAWTYTYSKGDKITDPPEPTKQGYILGGWYREKDCTNAWDFENDVLEGNTTLYPKWIPVTYKVHFNANGGEGTMEDQVFSYDASASLTANAFTKADSAFVGWSTAADSNVVAYSDKQAVKNLFSDQKADGSSVYELFAVWKAEDGHKHNWTGVWTWDSTGYQKAVTLTLSCEGEEPLIFSVTPTWKASGNRTTYYVEFTYNGVKYSDSKTFLNNGDTAVEITEKAFAYEGVRDYTYTGNAITQPNLKVYWGESILVEGTDYTVKYKNNVNAGKATMTIAGKGQYDTAFTEEVSFTIEPFKLINTGYTDGIILDTDKIPDLPLKIYTSGKTISKKAYTLTYTNGAVPGKTTKAGEYIATYKANGTDANIVGETSFKLTVLDSTKELPVNKLKVKIDADEPITMEQVRSEEGYIPKITVTVGSESVSSTDKAFDTLFTVKYYQNKSTGIGGAHIFANEGCKLGGKEIKGAAIFSFTIKGQKFTKEQKAKLNQLKNKSVPYTGQQYYFYSILEALDIVDEYYGILGSYANMSGSVTKGGLDKGKMTLTITGTGIYNDKLTIPMKVVGTSEYDISFVGFADAKDGSANEVPYKAGGTTVTGLTVRALEGGYLLREGVDYTVAYKNNKNLTTGNNYATLTIKGKGNYGNMTIPFSVVANKLSVYDIYTIPAEITSSKIDATAAKIASGKAKAPAVYDAVTGKKLKEGKDFTYEYGAYDEAAKIFPVTIKQGTDKTYVGEVILDGIHVSTEKLIAKGKKANIALKSTAVFYYTGKAVTLTADDFDTSGGKAVYGKDFEIIGYKKNIKAGTASVTVKAIGDKFGGTATIKFKINKAKKN